MTVSMIARTEITVNAAPARVWAALIDPKAIKEYYFGSDVTSDWTVGSEIVWQGEWQGKKYRDHGRILQLEPERALQYTHFSPLSGQPDLPENYHTVTITLQPSGTVTTVALTQDGNPTDESRKHSEENWATVLGGLKAYLER